MVAIIFISNAWGSPQEDFALASSSDLSTEGYMTFSWSLSDAGSPDHPSPLLQVATNPQFEPVVRQFPLHPLNLEKAQIHVSGFHDGAYYARIGETNNTALSNVIQFQVKHRNLSAAFFIFSIGLLLFIGMCISLLRFSQRDI